MTSLCEFISKAKKEIRNCEIEMKKKKKYDLSKIKELNEEKCFYFKKALPLSNFSHSLSMYVCFSDSLQRFLFSPFSHLQFSFFVRVLKNYS